MENDEKRVLDRQRTAALSSSSSSIQLRSTQVGIVLRIIFYAIENQQKDNVVENRKQEIQRGIDHV